MKDWKVVFTMGALMLLVGCADRAVAPRPVKVQQGSAKACGSYYVRWGRDSVLVQGCE